MTVRTWLPAIGVALALASGPASAQQAPGALVVPVSGELRSLSPGFAADLNGYHSTSNIYSTLITLDWGIVRGTSAYGDLAESWETSPDGMAVTFKLHRNARWHDGKPVTAHDVKFTYDTIIRKKYPAFLVLQNVAEVVASDDHTVVLKLKTAETGFVPMLAQQGTWTAKIYPKHLWEKEDGFETGPHVNNPVGSGPFKFVRWNRGSLVELEANKEYFRGAPKVDRIILRLITDVNVARAEFDAGRIQLLPFDYAPPLAEVPALQRNPAMKVVFTESHFSRDIQLNIRKGPLEKLQVRQAIAHAIDRDSMNKLAFNNLWRPGVHASVESQGELINRNAKFPEFDKARAEKLLDEAGYPRGADGWRFPLAITNPPFSDCRAMMEVLTQQLRQVGINARIEVFDQATWFRRQGEGQFDVSCYFTRYGPDPDAFREHFSTGSGRNFMGYANPEFDDIVKRASAMKNGPERTALYHKAQELIVRDLPYINLFNERKTSLVQAGWSGFMIEEEGFNKSMTWFGYYGVKPPGR